MAFTTVDNPELFFQAKTFSGNGGTNAITLDGSEDMQPDWVWLKKTNGTANHHLVDSVRGAGRYVFSNLSNAEGGDGTGLLTSFNSDGFTLDSGADSNGSGATGVGWCWKAGTSFSNDASSTGIGTIDSTGSASDTAGFSIVSWTGTGSNGTIKHGLSSVIKTIIVKNRSTTDSWFVYHVGMGNNAYMHLETTNAALSPSTNQFQATTPTSSVFSVGTADGTNKSSSNMIAYCFAEKQGYSKFGDYTGNGNADGPFIYTGFKPAFLLVKSDTYGSGNWRIFDNKRSTTGSNVIDDSLKPNTSATNVDETAVDFCSNGFKYRANVTDASSGGTGYIYMAIAESPFVNSSGVPNNAR